MDKISHHYYYLASSLIGIANGFTFYVFISVMSAVIGSETIYFLIRFLS
jgi:hypothetical protein